MKSTPKKKSTATTPKKKKVAVKAAVKAPLSSGAPRLVTIPDRSCPDEPLKAHYYAAEGKATGLCCLAPGSKGGMGPGQEKHTPGLFNPRISSVYPDVARALAARGIAVIHFTWRLNPTRKGAPPGTLKSPHQLMLGVKDIALASRYLRAQQGKHGQELPLVLVGFSFGGPSVMAAGALAVLNDGGGAAAAAGATGLSPLSGVVTMGCGARVGHTGSEWFKDIGRRLVGGASKALPHEYNGVDSESCVDIYASAGLPLAMIHGLADTTVDVRASQAIFERARGPKAALWLENADHHARNRFDVVAKTMLEWVPALLLRPPISPGCLAGALPGALPRAEEEAGLRYGRAGSSEASDAVGARSASQEVSKVAAEAEEEEDEEEEEEDDEEEEPSESSAPSLGDEEEQMMMMSRWGANDGEEDYGSSAAGSDVASDEGSDPPSVPSSARVGELASSLHAPLRAMALKDVGLMPPPHSLPPVAVVADAHCPFLNGESQTV